MGCAKVHCMGPGHGNSGDNTSNPKLKPPTPTTNGVSKRKPRLAAPLHPGFPQKRPIPTKEEYKSATEEAALRNAANRAAAHHIRDTEINKIRPNSYKDAAQRPPQPSQAFNNN
jgi:hypothetical protein